MLKIGSHVTMSGKEMFLASVKEALSYGANTFMVYTGAPQNSKRKPLSELMIPEAKELMKKENISEFVVHAPYLINLGNSVKPETYSSSVEMLREELIRTEAMGGSTLVLHPGAHVNAGVDVGMKKIIEGLNEVLSRETKVTISLETMAGKGSEIGRSFEELAEIFNGVVFNEKLRVCFDTCHVHDAGYDLVNQTDEVFGEFDRVIGKEKIAVFHINDSMNGLASHKDRHANIGFGTIGFETLKKVVYREEFLEIPKILETPHITVTGQNGDKVAPYRQEIEMLRKGEFHALLIEELQKNE